MKIDVSKIIRILKKSLVVLMIVFNIPNFVLAEQSGNSAYVPGSSGVTMPSLSLSFNQSDKPQDIANVIKIVLLLTVLSLAPAILIMMTSFTRIVIVLSFLRQSIGIQNIPPNQLLIGLALFLSMFVMAPTLKSIHQSSIEPYLNNQLDMQAAMVNAEKPIREFMFAQTREKDLELFLGLGKFEKPENKDDVPTYVLVPSFVISELKTAFQIGFLLYLPFIVLDMVIASVLMAMGMMMLPPMMISLPFKILLFVLVDGWELVITSLVKSFGV